MPTKNVLRLDPSRTGAIRRQFMSDVRRRFAALRAKIIRDIGERNILGLVEDEPTLIDTLAPLAENAKVYRFRTSAEKMTQFQKWLDEQLKEGVLKAGKGIKGQPYLTKYIESAYKKGVVKSYTDVTKGKFLGKTSEFAQGSKAEFLRSAFAQPERIDKVKLLGTRSWEGMKGLTATMKADMNRIMADAIAHGKGAKAVARDLNKIVGIGKGRALRIARTEIIHAHAEGQLDSLTDLGVSKVGAAVEFTTAGDDLVCEHCEDLEGQEFTIEEARGVIPVHPNCRCAWLPIIQDEDEDDDEIEEDE
jgi:SPP1 gp7 family putative phage head morphogenesis protein